MEDKECKQLPVSQAGDSALYADPLYTTGGHLGNGPRPSLPGTWLPKEESMLFQLEPLPTFSPPPCPPIPRLLPLQASEDHLLMLWGLQTGLRSLITLSTHTLQT